MKKATILVMTLIILLTICSSGCTHIVNPETGVTEVKRDGVLILSIVGGLVAFAGVISLIGNNAGR